ncbi:MAG: aminoglycoside 3'-phosphotransferase/choline kinase family protein [Lachnospiraceae bacterium]|nr:aminoglycoside 3'-phosphotransferase/choline kinase family protein [Lachnospiraceae bacterium]
MPISITKSTISEECINRMVEKAFGCKAYSVEELTEGFFNIAYKVQVNNQAVILKVAPPMDVEIMTHEQNIMFSEADSMRMVREKTTVPVPQILFFDDSHTICDRSYFFMEMLEGRSFSSCMEQLSDEEKGDIFCQVGKYTKELNGLTGNLFGYYCQQDKQGDNWYSVFRSMVEDTYADAQRKDIHIPVAKEQLMELLEEDREIFEEVKRPKFVHWDIWAGNVFIQGKDITGIIDFERCLWADELMEVGFRTYGYEQGFFDGYGIPSLTKSQQRRARWYDIYLFLIVSLESDYRQYETKDSYHWACDMLNRWVVELKQMPKL